MYSLVKNLVDMLTKSASGVGFVYDALDAIADDFKLIDIVLVVDNDYFGRQMFRLGKKQLDPDMFEVSLLETAPGLYSQPEIDIDQGPIMNLFELALNSEHFRHDARHDGLTNLLNRRSFDEILSNLSFQSGRYGWQFALVLMDLNDFKQVNDTKGHLEGDRILKEAARVLSNCLRSGDRVARVGGDEFALVLANANDEGASQVVDRIKTSLKEIDVTISAGVAIAPTEATEILILWNLADKRLYDDKQVREHL